MEEASTFMLQILAEERTQARQSEDQRSTSTGIIVVIAAAIQGALTQTGFTHSAIPLTITLVCLGIFGAISSVKLYERYQYHINRAKKLRLKIEEFYPQTCIQSVLDSADNEHMTNYPLLSQRIRVHHLWLS